MERITAEEAARRLGINLRTLWRWRDAGKIAEAGRVGRSVMFYALDVDALRGVDASHDLDLADVYRRLALADTWEDVHALKSDVADTLCTHADGEGREAIRKAWRAASALAATHPQEGERGHWTAVARRYGAWLGVSAEETDALIARRATGSYESAKAEAEAAPLDPAYAVASLSKGEAHGVGAPMSDNAE